jgi:hypothetical protein
MDRNSRHKDLPGMGSSESMRKEVEEFLSSLSAQERREHIQIVPAYRSAYNSIVRPDRRNGAVSTYFFEKWAPHLGPIASMLYLVIRRIAFTNEDTPEDTWCYPDQSELAKMIGLSESSRKTVRKHLDTLEQYRFLKRDRNYRIGQSQAHGGAVARQSTSRYWVWHEVPLTDEDEVMFYLLNEEARNSFDDKVFTSVGSKTPYRPTSGGFKTPHREPGVGLKTPSPESYPQENSSMGFGASSVDPSYNVKEINVHPTLNNVMEQSSFSEDLQPKKKSEFMRSPGVARLTPLEKAQKDELVREIARTLNACSGDHGNEEHKSAGFHRRVGYLMPEIFVREALMAVRDAVEDDRSGKKSLRKDPAAYFAGIVREISKREGLELGIKNWR